MKELGTVLESGAVTPGQVETFVGRLVTVMPQAIREEVLDMPAFKAELTQAIYQFAQRFESQSPGENDFQNLVALIISIVVRHHAFSLINNRGLDAEALPADFDPTIQAKYPMDNFPVNSINLQKGLGLFVWIASFYTSWQGLTHYIGEYGINAFTSVTGLKVAPNAAYWARTLSSIAISGYVSQIVQRWKSAIEDRAHKEAISGPSAAVASAADLGRKNPKGLLLAMAALAVVFDVGTNFNGVITAAGQRKEIAAQIDGAQGEIDGRVADVRAHMRTIQDIPQELGATVDKLLREERGGDSETRAAGVGPIYHTKAAVYTENGPSISQLAGTDFKDQLKGALDGSGLVDGQTLEQEVKATVDDSTDTVEGLLGEVEALSLSLDPTKEPEAVQADLDKVVAKLEEALGILNNDLPDDLNARMARYDAFSREMIRIAQTVGGSAYAGLQPDRLHSWELPDLAMENTKIEVDDIHYVGFEDIIRVMKENYTPLSGSILLLLAAILAYLNSYADLHTLPWTRKAYARDAAEAEEKKRKFIDQSEEKLLRVLLTALNEGPFSKQFVDKEQHHSLSVQEVIEERIRDLATLRKDTRSSLWGWSPVGPGEADDWRGQTQVAQEHNARVRAIQRILGNRAEIQGLLERLLPGFAVLQEPRPGERFGAVIQLNEETIAQRNATIQNREIAASGQTLNEIQREFDRLGARMTTEEWEDMNARFLSNLGLINGIAARLYPHNQDAFNSLQSLEANVAKTLSQQLPKIVSRELSNLELRDTTPDARLLTISGRLIRLENILGAVRTDNIDHEREITSARRDIAAMQGTIREIQDARRKRHREADRLEENRLRMDRARRVVQRIEPYMDERHAQSGMTDRTIAGTLANALNERHLTFRNRLDAATVARLRAEKTRMDDALDVLIAEGQDAERYGEMKTALRDDWLVLEKFF